MSVPGILLAFPRRWLRRPSVSGSLRSMRIGTRLALAFAVMLLLTGALGAFTVIELSVVKKSSDEITQKWMAGVRLTSQMNTDASNFRIAEVKHILASDSAERSKYEDEMRSIDHAMAQNADEYSHLTTTPEERKLFASFKRERQRYLDEHLRMMRLSSDGQVEDAKALLTYNSQKKYEGASAALRKLVDYNIQGGRAASGASDRTYAVARRWIVAALAAALALGFALSFGIARSIGKPLKVAVSVANAVSEGDLAVNVPAGGRDETGQLLHALQVMTASLGRLVNDVFQGSEQVASSSQQIATGNADLSHRTETQASRLAQVASSMSQLQNAVRAIDDSASQAARLAGGASSLAGQGSAVMGRVVETMRSISVSSNRIGDITRLIDDIAFKTNILALNAAVEAARAGDAGRGFGVVAGEVRALAKNSAQAAKDIKALIDESKVCVDAGSTLVGEAGGAMDKISAQAQTVSELIGRISAATSAQSGDIAAVCEAVAELDAATQQNSALVEQSAAASESLREQARQLVEAVAVFRTRGG